MTEHLTSQQVTAWRSGVSGADELLRMDDHLAECGECRLLVAGSATGDDGSAIRMLQGEFSSAHLTEAQLDDYAGHRPLPADTMQHLDRCAECRGDAEDLRRFADASADAEKAPVVPIRRTLPVWLRPMAAVIAMAALGLSVWFAVTRQRSGQPVNRPAASAEIAFNIPAEYRSEVQAAMDSGNLRIPESIAGMTAGPIQLRSTEVKEAAFHVLSPLTTAVVEDSPVFRWTPVAGATFSVSVYDDGFHSVARSPSLQGTEWRPEKPLARGATYRWEVRAVKGKHVDRAPAPTEPEARFAVLGQPETARLAEARTAMPHAPLAMGILYAQSGALEDARRELTDAASSTDPKQKAAAERLLEKLPASQLPAPMPMNPAQ